MSEAANIEVVEAKLLAGVVADEIIASIQEAIGERGSCSLVLAGGRTPGSIYRLLSRPPRVNQIEWDKVTVFWGDERWVPPDDTQSNFKLASETLLSHIPDPGPEVFPVDTSVGSAKQGAKKYEEAIRGALKLSSGEIPKFDLVLLGVGEDGHTASIFPGSELLKGGDSICYAVKHPNGGADRVTFSPKVLSNARRILFIARGESKAEIVHRVLEGDEKAEALPARLFDQVRDVVTWFVDSEAATKLSVST